MLKSSEPLNNIAIINCTLHIQEFISYSINHLFDSLLPFQGKMTLHDSRQRPSWQLEVILLFKADTSISV